MAKTIGIRDGGHIWTKTNQITLKDKRGFFDILQCTGCQIMGKRRNLELVEISASYGKKINCCDAYERPKTVQIKSCDCFNPAFENITPGSIHQVISAPKSYADDANGVWVMGKGEPVKVLNYEFEVI